MNERETSRTIRVHIRGAVQGVGFRAFIERNALALGLSGWVRNRVDGSVEALFSGADDQVEEMVRRCRTGPALAAVDEVVVAEEAGAAAPGFKVLPTC